MKSTIAIIASLIALSGCGSGDSQSAGNAALDETRNNSDSGILLPEIFNGETSPGPINVTNSFTTIGPITVGPYPYDLTVTCAATGYLQFTSTAPTAFRIDYGINDGTNSYVGPLAVVINPPDNLAPGRTVSFAIAQNESFSLLAGRTGVYKLKLIEIDPPTGSPAAQLFNAILRCKPARLAARSAADL